MAQLGVVTPWLSTAVTSDSELSLVAIVKSSASDAVAAITAKPVTDSVAMSYVRERCVMPVRFSALRRAPVMRTPRRSIVPSTVGALRVPVAATVAQMTPSPEPAHKLFPII
jgi:hypothetical protein